MPSPFPGMNPYLEHEDAWHNFHQQYTDEFVTALEAQVGAAYFVKLDETVYVHELPGEPRQFLGRADVFLGESGGGGSADTAATALATAPATERITLPDFDAERVPFVEIRDRRNRRLVTVIELLSPSNKRSGRDRTLYEAKRRRILNGPTNFVEIDLLRAGPRMPFVAPAGGTYGVLVSRGAARPAAEWYAIGLRQPLPTIPVPLAGDAHAALDLQTMLHRLHDAKGYAKFIYDTAPDPPLAPDDAAWARGVLLTVGIVAAEG
ncbi:MAG: DUF4058 family protein [Gemmataceae bacterium]